MISPAALRMRPCNGEGVRDQSATGRGNENETSRLKFYEVRSASPARRTEQLTTGRAADGGVPQDDSSSDGVLKVVSSVGGAAS
jgi:hypothetical protein